MCGIVFVAALALNMMPIASAEVQAETVLAGSYGSFTPSLNAGDRYVFTLVSTDNPINVYLTDNENFYKFEAGEVFNAYSGCSLQNAMSGTFTFIAPEDGVYHLILSNRDGVDDAHFEYESVKSTPVVDPDPVDTTDEDDNSTPGFDMPVIVVATVVGVGIFAVMRRRM